MKQTACVLTISALLAAAGTAFAQDQIPGKEPKAAEPKAEPAKAPPKEESSVTGHTIHLNGETISYKATAGTILLKNEKDEPIANLFYVAYTRSGEDLNRRPLIFLYNGGPGGSSVPLHMAAFGPRRVVTLDATATPPSPYKVVDNTCSLLDVADLVFIDPVGTGFSRPTAKGNDKEFWGIDEDVRSLAQFINSYVSGNDRWNSPKFLLGESYGTFRNAALVNYLQSRDGMDFNGVVMISTVLDLGTLSFNPGDDRPYIFYLPSYAAAAWYHKLLKDRPTDLPAFLNEARQFAATEYAAALMKGSQLDAAEKTRVLKKLARFTGLSEDYLTKANLRVNAMQFRAELQRAQGLTTGRYDARFSGPEIDLLDEQAKYDPVTNDVFGALTASFNHYVRDDLKYGKSESYRLLNSSAAAQWNWKHSASNGIFGPAFPGSPNVETDLVQAMIGNPHLKVQVENGLYDFATPFFATEYTMDHLRLPDRLRANIQMEYYTAGHMMYLHEPDLQKLKRNVASFIQAASEQ